MAEYNFSTLEYNHPRTIWSINFQLFYTLVCMIPFYYYLQEILQLPESDKWIIYLLPIATGLLLFMLQLRLNNYFWKQEKLTKARDIFYLSSQSLLVAISLFYFFELFIFSYWVNSFLPNIGFTFSSILSKLMTEVSLTLLVILLTIILMETIQHSRYRNL